jgi:hypothetical protein
MLGVMFPLEWAYPIVIQFEAGINPSHKGTQGDEPFQFARVLAFRDSGAWVQHRHFRGLLKVLNQQCHIIVETCCIVFTAQDCFGTRSVTAET